MKIAQIDFDDTLDIRQKVLWPTKPREFCVVDGDEQATHYGVFSDGRLVGVASTYEQSGSVRLRKFAVDAEFQGSGFGSALLTHIINEVKDSGSRNFWCDARETALNFYHRFGMLPEGDRFYKAGVPYYTMSISF